MRMVLAFVALIGGAILVMALFGRPNDGKSFTPKEEAPPTSAPAQQAAAADPARAKAFDKYKEGAIQATLEIENRGTMKLELYPKAAPKTVAHFVELAKKGFYDGIKFHRIVPNFVIQAGDPESKNVGPDEFDSRMVGTHGSGKMVPLEANLPHVKDSIGLARSQEEDSGDSQFYINLKDNADLDGKYCVFGRVIEGADIAAKVEKGDKITRLSVP